MDSLQSEFGVKVQQRNNPFLILVRTILSQNTNRKNTEKAYKKLTSQYTSAKEFLEAGKKEIMELIKPAGLYKSKGKNLVKIAKESTENKEKNLDKILQKPLEEAREKLLTFPGVGPKTADCVLLFAGEHDVMPVDTHVNRISRRLGLTGPNSDKEQVKQDVESILPKGERGKAHLLLIELGRTYCTARNPKCSECPIEKFCPKIGI